MADQFNGDSELGDEPLDIGADVADQGDQDSPSKDGDGAGAGDKSDQPKRMSVRESINDAIRQASKPKDDAPKSDRGQTKGQSKPPGKGAAAPGQQAGDKGSAPPQGGAPGAATSAPDAWKSKEMQPIWQGLAPAVQAAITKREADMAKGVEQLKARHQDIENVITPNREQIKRFGFTEPQAIDQMFKWQAALAGPDKIRAFVALMQSHGVDPATFAAALHGDPPGATKPNGNGAISPELKTEIDGIKSKLGMFDQHFSQQTQNAAQQLVTTWAKDRPHFDRVRTLMGQLLQSGAVPLKDGQVDLDAAYAMAIYAHPEVRMLVTAEGKAKADTERKAANDRARKAGSSMRPGAPVPPTPNSGKDREDRNETVRGSILRALEELRAQ